MGKPLTHDSRYAGRFQEVLQKILLEQRWFEGLSTDEYGNAPEVNTSETYAEQLYRINAAPHGLVLDMSDGARVWLTIEALTPPGLEA